MTTALPTVNFPAKPFYDVIVTGSYFCDLVFTGLPTLPQLGTEIYAPQLDLVIGGGAANTAIALRRLAVNVGLATELGDDLFSRFAADQLRVEGIDATLINQSASALRRLTVSLSYPQDRAFVTYVDPAPTSAERAARALASADCRHIHFPGLSITPTMLDILTDCRTRGINVSMDCQHRAETLQSPLVCEILSQLAIFMPNETEALRLTGADSVETAIRTLAEITPCVVIKRGAAGAIARWRGIEGAGTCEIPAIPSVVIDTTGAGDIFNAGFLAAYLERQPIAECVRWGNYCGALSVRGVGGTQTAPTRSQLTAWLTETV